MHLLQLSIPEPCHESWDAMTPVEKGRFCAACQKTVVDFSRMSDREIAQFFKRKPDSVCGYIRPDQLARDIVIPKKRIPWAQYLMQITWPAFVLFLKSCGTKEKDTVVTPTLQKETSTNYTVGEMVMMPIPGKKTEQKKIRVKKARFISLANQVQPNLRTSFQPSNRMEEPVVVRTSLDTRLMHMMAGGLSYRIVRIEGKTDSSSIITNLPEPVSYSLYPNPARAGARISISYTKGQSPQLVQLLSFTGQLLAAQREQKHEGAGTVSLQLPAALTPGLYYVRIIPQNGEKAVTKKLVVQ